MVTETVSDHATVAKGGEGVKAPTQAVLEPLVVNGQEDVMKSSVSEQKVAVVAFASSAPVSTVRGTSPPPARPELNGVVSAVQKSETHQAPLAEPSASNSAFETPRATNVRRSPPGSGPSEEAAALLLNFSTVGDHAPLPSIAENATYPHTPPLDSPTAPPRSTVAVAAPLTASSPTGLPTPHTASPEVTTAKPSKQKRKRTNAVAGPSRQSSTDPNRPTHSMGEDNTLIRCICGFVEDDGFTMQCEGCYAWEHGQCFGYTDEDSVPDIYYCELCEPRPVDATAARLVQLQSRATWESRRVARVNEVIALEQAKKSRSKPKRPRTESSNGKDATGKENEPQQQQQQQQPEETQDTAASSSSVQAGTKPRRKPQPTKPRSRASEGGGYFSLKDGQEDDEFFRFMPWELEYTPLKGNIIRGVAARHAVSMLRREWVEGEETPPSKRQQRPYHDSGLPSPTDTGIIRLSPDDALSPPDFAVLAPPVPPVFLSGPDLAALASPTYIRPVDDSACFLPLKYSEPSSGIFARPTIYGVFTQDVANQGTFFGEYRCEVLDAATYRKDPINQYSALGIPKPYVHSVGPPVNLMLDARSYGNELRFVRSGCHPNAVIRPVFHRSEDSKAPKLVFGIFASRELAKNEEIVLAWEWDDQHVVHTLRAIIDSTLKNAATKPLQIAAPTVEYLTTKFDSILTNVLGTFQSCACTVNTDCAFAQMRRLVNGQTFHGVSGARARKRIDLGELVGAVRGWRRRELEVAAASAKAQRFRSSTEWDVWRAGPISTSGEEVNAQPSHPPSDEPSPEGRGDEDEAMEEQKPEAPAVEVPEEDVSRSKTPEAVIPVPPSAPLVAEEENAMDVDADDEVVEDKADVDMEEAAPATPIADKVAPPMPPSSILSSVPSDPAVQKDEEGEEELSSGNESDATTITLARSTFSDGESDNERRRLADSDAADEVVRPAAVRRGRRVVSPVAEPKPQRRPSAKGTPTKSAKDNKRRPRKNVIASSDEDASSASEDEAPPAPKVKARPRPVGLKASKGRRRAAPKSESESETPSKQRKAVVKNKSQKPNGTPRGKERVTPTPSKDAAGDSAPRPATEQKALAKETTPDTEEAPSRSEKAKLEKELTPQPKESTPTPSKQPSPPVEAPVQPPKEATPPPKEATPPPKEPTPPPKESTPPPREPTPPPKEPTPPPPKKVSMREYLATHKIRKISNPVATKDIKSEAQDDTPSKDSTPSDSNATASTVAKETPPVAVADSQRPTPLNLMEHLPSSRSSSVTTPLATPFTPATPSTASAVASAASVSVTTPAFVPRTDYFNSQPVTSPSTPAFVPRHSSSFVPRQSGEDSPAASAHSTPVFVPRQQDKEHLPLVSPGAPRAALPPQTSPRPAQSLPEVPPALGVRDGPPHYAHHSHRPPPTGPRIPPTGPRGGWSGAAGAGPPTPNGPVSPHAPMRGGAFPPRGGFGRGGFERGFGFRGRGLRGRGRGM